MLTHEYTYAYGAVDNRVFKSLDALEDHLTLALKTLEDDPNTVGSIVTWPWIIAAFLTSLMNYKLIRPLPRHNHDCPPDPLGRMPPVDYRTRRARSGFGPRTSCQAKRPVPDRDRIGGGLPVEVDETWVGGRTRGEEAQVQRERGGKGSPHGTCASGWHLREAAGRKAPVGN